MDVLVLYESITGNTALGVEVIRSVMEKMGHACSVARFGETSPEDVGGRDLYCFATPVQSFAPMATAWRFVRRIPKVDAAPAFIFSTRGGWPGAAHTLLARRLKRRGFVVLGNHYLTCETSFPVLRSIFGKLFEPLNLPRKKALLKLVDFAGEMAGKAERLRRGLHVELPAYRLVPGPTLPMAINALHGGLSRSLGRRTVDMDLCDLCGICAGNCPVSAITIDGRPVFNKSCIGCWGCFNVCPHAAIRTNIVKPSSYYGGIKDKASKLAMIGLARRD